MITDYQRAELFERYIIALLARHGMSAIITPGELDRAKMYRLNYHEPADPADTIIAMVPRSMVPRRAKKEAKAAEPEPLPLDPPKPRTWREERGLE